MTENDIAAQVVDAAFKIHTTLGPGLLESVYEAILAEELARRGLQVSRQQGSPLDYGNDHLEAGFHADLVAEGNVIVEIKAVEAIAAVHRKQLLSYLKLADKRLGLLMNFDVERIKDGIMRVVNGLEPQKSFSQRR
jgi:GxxExxY protein